MGFHGFKAGDFEIIQINGVIDVSIRVELVGPHFQVGLSRH